MLNYIIPLSALVLDFACFAFCLKFIITNEWRYWLLPSLLSVSMTAGSIICLMSMVFENSEEQIASFAFSISVVLSIISFLWLCSLLLFAYRLKSRED